MAITGNLKTMELAELLQWLSGSRKTGTLAVARGTVSKGVSFRDGRIIGSSSSDPREQLGALLVSHGFVTDQELAKAIEVQRQQRLLLGEILVAAGAVSEPDLVRILRLKAEEILYDMFTWSEGEFRFLDGELPPPETLVPLALEVTGVVLEGMQRIDEWKGIRDRIPDADGVPVAVSDWDRDEMGEWDATVLSLIDDDRSIREICLAAHASEFYVSKILLRQIHAGRLKLVRARRPPEPDPAETRVEPRPLDGEALGSEARQRLAKGELDVALRYSRAARVLAPDDRKLAALAGEIEDAVRRELGKAAMRPTDVPRLVRPLAELAQQPFTPQEGFLLSRIDGVQNLAAIVRLGPLPATETQLLLHKLIESGHVRLEAKR